MIILPPFYGCLTPAGGFDPLSLSPTAWIDASNQTKVFDAVTGGSLPANGGAIARIEDSTTNGYNFTQATLASRPARSAALVNGQDAATYDGADRLDISASSWLADASAMSFFVVMRNNFTGQARTFLYSSTNTVAGTPRLNVFWASSNRLTVTFRRLDADSTSSFTPTTTFPTGWFLIRIEIDVVNQTVAAAINQSSIGSATGFGTGGNTDSSSSLLSRIGGSVATAHLGDIATTLAFRRILTSAERSNLESWLSTRYNLPVP